jgi:hypothetical protein
MRAKIFAKVIDGGWFYFDRVIGVLLLLPVRKMRRVYVMGDSHTLVFEKRVGVICRHLGPITLNRFGRENEAKGLFYSAFSWPRRLRWLPFPSPSPSSTVVLSFGEIDIRAHVDRISRELSMEHSEVVFGLADSAIRGISEIRKLTKARIVFLGPPPPVKHFLDEKFPTGGSFDERVKWMNELKLALSSRISEIDEEAVFFCDLAHRFQTTDGDLKSEFSDGTVHYSRAVGSQLLASILSL